MMCICVAIVTACGFRGCPCWKSSPGGLPVPCDTSHLLPIGNYYHRLTLAEHAKTVKSAPQIFSPTDHVPVHIACSDAPCVQSQRLLSLFCIIHQRHHESIDEQKVSGRQIGSPVRTSPGPPSTFQRSLRICLRGLPTYDPSTLFPAPTRGGAALAVCSCVPQLLRERLQCRPRHGEKRVSVSGMNSGDFRFGGC